ncbi:hypothetical protein FRC03_011080 [Tulasnella sp. 419]|nr:hypothetical protein FRC02_011883 [Tulasnella sp. 418]KAG8966895.1 hypothetical protein FRC03_011080 [Tulasnella sp. 419]
MAGLTRFFTSIFKPFTSCFRPQTEPAEPVPPLSQRISPPKKLRSIEHPIALPHRSASRPSLSRQFSSATTTFQPSVTDVKITPHPSYDDFSTRAIPNKGSPKRSGLAGSFGIEHDGVSSGTRSTQPTLWNYPVREKKSSTRLNHNLPPLPPTAMRRPLPHNSTLRLDMDTKPFRDLHINTIVAQAAPVYTDELATSPSEMSVSEYPRYDEDGRPIPRTPAEISSLSLKEKDRDEDLKSATIPIYPENAYRDGYPMMTTVNGSAPVTILPRGYPRHLDDLQ